MQAILKSVFQQLFIKDPTSDIVVKKISVLSKLTFCNLWGLVLFLGEKKNFFKGSVIFFFKDLIRGANKYNRKYVNVAEKNSFISCNNGFFSVPVICGWILTEGLVSAPPTVSKGFLWLSGVVRHYLFGFIPLTEKSATGQCPGLTSDLQENVTLLWPGCCGGLEEVWRQRLCIALLVLKNNKNWVQISKSSLEFFQNSAHVKAVKPWRWRKRASVCLGRQAACFRRGSGLAIYGRGHFACWL